MRIRSIFTLVILIGLICVEPIAAQQSNETQLINAADALTRTATRLRGLEPKSPIKKGVKSREEILQFLNKKVREDYDPARILQEGKMLQKLGMLPEGTDYQQLILNVLTEQIEGFYDPEQKTFFIASWLPAEGQEPVMIHELTHALQDQYFDVKKILDKARRSENDDRILAQQALLEGDGLVVMFQYLLNPLKRHFSTEPNLAYVMKMQMEASQAQSKILKAAPQFLKETLIFPYGYGAAFLQQIWKQNPSWDAVNKIYSDLPVSTEQIMHPEKYYRNRDNPKPVDAQAFAAQLGSHWKVVYKNVLGEFSLGLFLGLHLNEERAKRSAMGWGGDQVLLLENESSQDAVLIQTEWDTADDSEKFFAAMDEWFRLHYPKDTRINVSPAGFSLVHNGEWSSLRREGTAVRIITGLPESDARKLTGL
jgi:hypothetical protein